MDVARFDDDDQDLSAASLTASEDENADLHQLSSAPMSHNNGYHPNNAKNDDRSSSRNRALSSPFSQSESEFSYTSQISGTEGDASDASDHQPKKRDAATAATLTNASSTPTAAAAIAPPRPSRQNRNQMLATTDDEDEAGSHDQDEDGEYEDTEHGNGAAYDTFEEVSESEGHTAASLGPSGRVAVGKRAPRGKKAFGNKEIDPELYGLRRSGRSKIQPKRYEVGV